MSAAEAFDGSRPLPESALAALDHLDALQARVVLLERQLEEAVEALRAIWTYIKADEPERHHRMGEACGVDACILCLAETTASEALARLSSGEETPDGG